MELNKKINFRQGKYILPAILYLPLLFAGYFIIDVFNIEIEEKKDASLVETKYLNADLPKANVKKDLGDKMDNMRRSFGNVRDLSAMQNIGNDRDSLMKKEDFQSKYNEKDRALLDTAAARRAETAAHQAETAVTGSDQSYDPRAMPFLLTVLPRLPPSLQITNVRRRSTVLSRKCQMKPTVSPLSRR